MSVKVGHITRHEDVHGVSGTGNVADVFEATNGKCIVIWNSAHSSVNVYDHIKDVERTHSHGGKSLVVWDYESPPEPDPMDKLVESDKPELSDEEIDEIAEEATAAASEIAATKVAEKIAEKVAEKKTETSLEDLEEEPVEDPDPEASNEKDTK